MNSSGHSIVGRLVCDEKAAKHLADAKFTTTTGADGTFSLGVAPGDYVVVPWKSGEPSPAEAVARPNALKITLQPNEHRSLDILK